MAFATAEDVATRIGQTLSAVEAERVDLLLDAATSQIAAVADKTDQWAAALNPVPRVLRYLCVELVVRTMRNPGGLHSHSEQLGQYRSSETFASPTEGGGLTLTDAEERLVRRVVYGTTTASVKTESVLQDLYPCLGS